MTEISPAEAKWFGPAFQAIADDPKVLVSAAGKEVMNNDVWIEENIGPWLGTGYSRSAFAMKDHPDLVFKIADDQVDDGRYTNGEEKKFFNKYPEFFPRVWMTSEHMEIQPHMRAGGDPRKDNLYLDWIIVDRVRPLERDEINEFLEKKFPVLKHAINEMPWRKPSQGSHHLGGPPVNIATKIFTKFLYSLEVGKPTHRFGLGGIRPYLNRELSIRVADKVIEKLHGILIKDAGLAKLSEVVDAVGMRTDEIRYGNIGTDIKTGTKLIFLDINRFLYSHGKESKNEDF